MIWKNALKMIAIVRPYTFVVRGKHKNFSAT